MGRTTINDVARAAGVSKGAVSQALNGGPGVSAATRARVLQVAADLQWVPSGTARALRGSRVGAVGWVIRRTRKTNTIDPYFTDIFTGIELALAETDLSLIVKLVADRDAELTLYQRWSREHRVDGVFVTDVDVDDPRFVLLRDMAIPTVSFRSHVGGRGIAAAEKADGPSVWFDETTAVASLLDLGKELGHTRVGWVSGDDGKVAVTRRRDATLAWQEGNAVDVQTRFTDYSADAGVTAMLDLLGADAPPTFLVFDNDFMAMAALGACQERGIDVPGSLSIASFIDSPLCQLTRPAITAAAHPIVGYGAALATRLVALVESRPSDAVTLEPPTVTRRGSTAARSAS